MEALTQKMKQDGWVVTAPVFDSAMIAQLNKDLEKASAICRAVQIKNGITAGTEGTAHHLIALAESFLEMLEKMPFWDFVKTYFEGSNYIINSYGGFTNLPSAETYVHNIHRDLRTFSGPVPMMLNMLVMLDDFTLENGATYLGTGTHLQDKKPEEAEFMAKAVRATGKAGSVLFFNSNLWHCAGKNMTNAPRRCFTLSFTRPYFKQQCDYPRMLGYDRADTFSEHMRQILGYNSRVPASLDEWYQPPEKRMYKPGQG